MEYILGIDLGTTNSEVAIYRDGKAVILEQEGKKMVPSVVGIDKNGKLLVGELARNQALLEPERTIRSIKRRMGEACQITLGNHHYSPQEISAMILRTLKKIADDALGTSVTKAVITVPAFFNDRQREATREAGTLAGLEVVRIINEPTAATLTYENQSNISEKILIYDLGGGTFDVSVVKIEDGVVEVLASSGDTHLGGDDFDQLLFDHVCAKFKRKHKVDLKTIPIARNRIYRAVEEAKKTLSSQPFANIEEEFICEKEGTPLNLTMEISRLDYETMIHPLLERTISCLKTALADALIDPSDLNKIILVGGSSRTPLVTKMIEEHLNQSIHSEIDPDLCVALGAAVQGALIAGIDAGPLLVDITPHTLGVKCLSEYNDGGLDRYHFAPLIKRNSAIPCRSSDVFYTFADNQTKVEICVYQGESSDVRNNTLIGNFHLSDLSLVDAGNAILCLFELDNNGILKVTATEKCTGKKANVILENALEVKPEKTKKFQKEIQQWFNDYLEDADTEENNVLDIEANAVSADNEQEESIEEFWQSSQYKEKYPEVVQLLNKAGTMREEASSQNLSDLNDLTEALIKALKKGKKKEIEKQRELLEDLLYYMEG